MLQVSVSLVVVTGAVLFLRSLHALLSLETGFARQNILVASVDVLAESTRWPTYRRLLEQLRRVPGVLAAEHRRLGSARHRHGLDHLHPGIHAQGR